ncbi:MAG: DNA recombination protein RmuC [Sphingobacteriales bacterium]|nr:MAG: DNA recombination protein RmuC [Sphingobacteriales bacterium]
MEIIFLLIGVVAGAAIGWFYSKSISSKNINELITAKALAEQQVNDVRVQLEQLKSQLNQSTEEVLRLNNQYATTLNENANLNQRLSEQKIQLEELNQKLKTEFENLANKILEEKSQKFTDQNKSNLDIILNPLKERIQEFEKKVDEAYKTESAERNSLKGEIKSLYEQSQKLNKEASNLTNALKGQTKLQGNWGEMILESILEKSGLVKGREYSTQESFTKEEGKRFQPDVVVKLPEEKSVIIDSKVSLVAYDLYCAAESDDDRKIYLTQHIQSLKNHMKGLSEKKYQQLYELDGLDYVIMFVPIEPAFNLAVSNEQNLWNEAFERNIVIVSTSTLWAVLRTIASIWKQEKQNNNSLEIARLSGSLYDKFVGFTEDLVDIGKKIDQSKVGYVEAMKKLSEGNGNLIRTTEKIKELGAKASKSLNTGLLQRSE